MVFFKYSRSSIKHFMKIKICVHLSISTKYVFAFKLCRLLNDVNIESKCIFAIGYRYVYINIIFIYLYNINMCSYRGIKLYIDVKLCIYSFVFISS